MTSTAFKVGQQIRFTREREIFPFALIAEGETGTVSYVSTRAFDSPLCVKMDREVDGLEQWDNEVVFSEDDEDGPEAWIERVR